MFVIKHKIDKQFEKYYQAKCSCGCVFDFMGKEASKERTINGHLYICCPDCGKTLSPEISEITIEQYTKDFDSFKKMFEDEETD